MALARVVPYDLVLMDCHMPEMNGLEATQAIRRLGGAHGSVPIIAMTADEVAGAREEAKAAGMDDFLAKPLQPRDPVTVLRRWVTHRAVNA